MFNKKIDFLAIGDIVTDAFIRLKEASVHCNIKQEECELCMKFADKIPYESVEVINAVGNSPNAAVSASRLGLSSGLMSDVGGDQNGKDCLKTLKEKGVSADMIAIHAGMKTNYHYVLWYESERTILVKHEDHPRRLRVKNEPKWFYLSSIGGNSENYHDEIADYLEKHPNVKLAFQPGTFQMKLGKERLKRIYNRSDILFCNVEEARKILGTDDSKNANDLLSMMRAISPNIVVITDGPRGAYAIYDNQKYFMPPYPDPNPPFERTGAGDAFASTFTSAIALGKTIEEALLWAPINSMSVVQKVGAQAGLLSQKEILGWLEKAPDSYRPSKI